MAGYVIHLSVAEEYLKKHPNANEDYNEFISGVIFPDSVKDKSETHYGMQSSQSNLNEFLKEHKLDSSFERGYFLHLLTDYLFYNKFLDCISTEIYNDYDILNDVLIQKYGITLPNEVKDKVFSKNGDLKILSMELVENLIKEISEYDLDIIADEVPGKWTKMKSLKRL